jgi:RNA 2',3'-cyclic 3'-phosphodiesterase
VPEGAYRLFVAVPVPPDALEACRSLIDGVRRGPAGRGARWVRTDNLHLTLRFLGDTPPARAPAVAEAVRRAAAASVEFEVRLAGAGAFPSLGRPRALWLGIVQGAAELGAIAAALEAPLAELGWPAEGRPFRPHLTVARTDAASIAAGAEAAALLVAAAAGWETAFRADRVVLYRSHLRAGPPIYEPVVEVALAG